MEETGDQVKQDKQDSERQMPYMFCHIQTLDPKPTIQTRHEPKWKGPGGEETGRVIGSELYQNILYACMEMS
jgi:hypothetical protein